MQWKFVISGALKLPMGAPFLLKHVVFLSIKITSAEECRRKQMILQRGAGMEDRFIKAAKGKGSNQRLLVKIREAEKMVKADAALNLDFVNIHWYEPLSDYNDPRISAPGVLKEVADYFRRKTGKKIITNEYGQLNDKPALTTSMIDAFRSANFKYAIIYSGTDADGLRTTQSLNDGILLTLIGEAFALAMIL